MRLPIWLQALRRIPRLTEPQWRRLGPLSRWMVLSRVAVLTITLLSCLLAGTLAWADGAFHWRAWLINTFGLLMAHASNNLLNDLTDYVSGVDDEGYFRNQYGSHPLASGWIGRGAFIGYMLATGAAALAAGVVLVLFRGTPVLWLLLAGAAFVLFYTYPLKHIGLGELVVVAVWGPLMVGGGYLVVTGHWRGEVALASVPYALGPAAIIFGKHIDKRLPDAGKRIRTLPVLLGERRSRLLVSALVVGQYLTLLACMAARILPWTCAVVLICLPTALGTVRIFAAPRPDERPADWYGDVWPLWFSAHTFLHNARFGAFMIIGVGFDVALRSLGG